MSSRRREASRRHIICGRLSLTNTIARLFNIGVTHQQGAFVIDDGVKPADEGVDPGKMAHIPVYNHPEIPRYLHIVRKYSYKFFLLISNEDRNNADTIYRGDRKSAVKG